MSEARAMTPEYVALSWRAANLAGAVDQYLGGSAFSQLSRFRCWDLTARFIVELQSAAMTLGVPAELISDIDDGARRQLNRPGFIAAAIAAQAEHDKQRQEGSPQ